MTRKAICDAPGCERLRRHASSGYCKKHHDRSVRGVPLTLAHATRPGEIWKPVADEPTYLVSSMGQVWSLRTDHISRPYPAPSGHMHIALSTDGGRKLRRTVHRLVIEAFAGPAPSAKHEVCHIDGDPANNLIENLRWGTRSDNLRDAVRHGTHFNAKKTHCKHGHEFDAVNTYYRPSGGRQCRACTAARRARFAARRDAA